MTGANMANMKMTAEEAESQEKAGGDIDTPVYPYGLRLCLSDGTLAKLKLNELPKIGAKMRVVGIAEVVSVSQYESKGDDESRNVDLQITDLELTPASALYDNSSMN